MKRAVSTSASAAWLTKPIIPVIWDRPAHGDLLAGAGAIFLQGCRLASLPGVLEALGRPPFERIPVLVHLDLVDGLTADLAGLEYLAAHSRINGLITTRHHLVPEARKRGMLTVLRVFLQDGRAVERGLALARKTKPDALELLPGVAAPEVADAFNDLPTPRIAGGLVRSAATARRILDSGCRAVSTSDHRLWTFNRPAR